MPCFINPIEKFELKSITRTTKKMRNDKKYLLNNHEADEEIGYNFVLYAILRKQNLNLWNLLYIILKFNQIHILT